VEASSLARELGVSAPTVSNYLTVLDQTYVNFLLPSDHSNLANELKKSRKTYLYDLGIRNSVLKDFRPTAEREDRGAIHESHVFLTLLPLLSPNMELRFWRTKKAEERTTFSDSRRYRRFSMRSAGSGRVPGRGVGRELLGCVAGTRCS
jgi:predicted AAA+ superfamily ATPase